MTVQTGLASQRMLWEFAAFLGICFALWLAVWPITIMAPSISHYKTGLPFTTAVELELGKAKATSLVVGERLEY